MKTVRQQFGHLSGHMSDDGHELVGDFVRRNGRLAASRFQIVPRRSAMSTRQLYDIWEIAEGQIIMTFTGTIYVPC